MKKLPLDDLIQIMNPEQRRACRDIITDYQEVIFEIPGSVIKHQAWPGGYISHLEEAMNLGIVLYKALNARRKLPFELSDVLFAVFLHDFDKLLRYRKTDAGIETAVYTGSYADQIAQIMTKKYGFKLTDEQFNAVKYAHGEGKDYSDQRVIMPLGTLVHCCDIISARIWFDQGKVHDSW